MKTKKPTLDHFNGSRLNPSQMKHVRGARETVPPQGDPGDIKDPSDPRYAPNPITAPLTIDGNSNLDPTSATVTP